MLARALWHLVLPLLLLPLGILAKDSKDSKAGRNVTKTINLRTHSLFAPYIDQDLQNRWWDFGSDAYVNTNKHVRLTRARPSQMGWLWSRLPISAVSYVVEVEFKISGDSTNIYGDGMAIWLSKTRAQPGPVFGSIDKFEGFGLFLDTYANARHTFSFPRAVGMIGDGKTSYDHANDGENTKIGACSANFRRTNVATKAKIVYIKDTSLEVLLQYKAWNDWVSCFKANDVTLPSGLYLGLSALTGDVFDAHDVISVSTSSAIVSDGDSNAFPGSSRSPHSLQEGGSWFSFFFKFVIFVGVCVGAFYGYQEYMGGGGGARLGRVGGYGGDIFANAKRF